MSRVYKPIYLNKIKESKPDWVSAFNALELLSNEEMFEIMDRTKAKVDEDLDEWKKDEIFRTRYTDYPIKVFGDYAIIPEELYNRICHETAYHLVFALGDIVGDFIDPEEYYKWTLKQPYLINGAQDIIKKLDDDAVIDIIEDVVDSFEYDGHKYVILEVY